MASTMTSLLLCVRPWTEPSNDVFEAFLEKPSEVALACRLSAWHSPVFGLVWETDRVAKGTRGVVARVQKLVVVADGCYSVEVTPASVQLINTYSRIDHECYAFHTSGPFTRTLCDPATGRGAHKSIDKHNPNCSRKLFALPLNTPIAGATDTGSAASRSRHAPVSCPAQPYRSLAMPRQKSTTSSFPIIPWTDTCVRQFEHLSQFDERSAPPSNRMASQLGCCAGYPGEHAEAIAIPV